MFLPLEVQLAIIACLMGDLYSASYAHDQQHFTKQRDTFTGYRLVCKAWDDLVRKILVRRVDMFFLAIGSRDIRLIRGAAQRMVDQACSLPADKAMKGLNAAAVWAASARCSSALELLLDAGIQPQSGHLQLVAQGNSLEDFTYGDNGGNCIRLLASRGANVNGMDPMWEKDDPHMTPLATAVHVDNLDATMALLEAGAYPSAQICTSKRRYEDCIWVSLLHIATKHRNLAMISELIRRGPALNDVKEIVRTAVISNDLGMLSVILKSSQMLFDAAH